MKKLLSVLFFLSIHLQGVAQDIEWIRAQVGDTSLGNESRLFTIDPSNFVYCQGRFQSRQLGTPDSAEIGILKYSPDGELLNFHRIPFDIIQMRCNAKGDLFLVAWLRNNRVYYHNQWHETPNIEPSLYLIKLDSSLQTKYVSLVSDKATLATNILYLQLDFLTNGDPIIGLSHRDPVYLNAIQQTIPGRVGGDNYLFLRFRDEAGSPIVWHEVLKPVVSENVYFFELSVRQNDEIVCSIKCGDFIYKQQTYVASGPGTLNNLVFSGSDAKAISHHGIAANHFNISDVFHRDNGDMLLSGVVRNSGPFSPDGMKVFQTSSTHFITACLDTSFALKWFIEEDSTVKTASMGSVADWEYRNGYYYGAVTIMGYSMRLGGYDMTVQTPLMDMFVLRMDTLGNMIWVLPIRWVGLGTMFGRQKSVDFEGNVYVWATYHDTLKVMDTAIVYPDQSPNIRNTYLLKLGDYYITRGEVSPGPYCAGDTFAIPFTIKGSFNPKNEFIAELSDEDGKFEGKERELGRITGNTNDTVWGVLPMFNVSSSPGYRIRLRSTMPPAQSFYRKDTLRLLVYSRDSANAGNDTLLCYGQSVQLKTTGGSRWEWSPGHLLNDSNLNKPLATPLFDTEFRIIISDSSGCGDTDTDYVWIQVRPPLRVDTLLTPDTACLGEKVSLKGSATGGDSLHYSFSWWAGGQRLADSFACDLKVLSDTSGYVKAEDGCSIPDSLAWSIKTRPPLVLSVKEDSACFRDSLRFSASASGGKPDYRVYWYEGAALKDSGMTYRSFSDSILPVRAVLSDGCTERDAVDTAFAIPYPVATWDLNGLTGCVPFLFEAEIRTQNKMVLQTIWEMNDTALYEQDPAIMLTQPGKYSWNLVLNPAGPCTDTLFSDTLVQVESAPVARFVSGPSFPTIDTPFVQTENRSSREAVAFEWHIDGNLSSTLRHPGFLFSDTGTYTIELTAYSRLGCPARVAQTVRIYDVYTIAIPNSFTPNQDVHNPLFAPVVTGAEGYRLQIYDRWGELLLNSENTGWNGTYQNKPVPEGVYMYRIDVKNQIGERFFYTGLLYLLR